MACYGTSLEHPEILVLNYVVKIVISMKQAIRDFIAKSCIFAEFSREG